MESHCTISANASRDGQIEPKGCFEVKYRDGTVSIWDEKNNHAMIGEFAEDNENLGYVRAEEFIERLFRSERGVRLHITQKRIDKF